MRPVPSSAVRDSCPRCAALISQHIPWWGLCLFGGFCHLVQGFLWAWGGGERAGKDGALKGPEEDTDGEALWGAVTLLQSMYS